MSVFYSIVAPGQGRSLSLLLLVELQDARVHTIRMTTLTVVNARRRYLISVRSTVFSLSYPYFRYY